VDRNRQNFLLFLAQIRSRAKENTNMSYLEILKVIIEAQLMGFIAKIWSKTGDRLLLMYSIQFQQNVLKCL
jgi:hypothetical protein